MKSLHWTAMSVLVLLLGLPAIAQDTASPLFDIQFGIVPAQFRSEPGGVAMSLPADTGVVSDRDLPTPFTAAPPPDPETPSWGQFLAPSEGPIVNPPREYNLIGPPRGIVQNIEGQDYQAVIDNPESLLADTQIDQPINIFRPDGMGPIGLFGDHTLPTGKAFISYKYLQNSFDQNYVGSNRVGPSTTFPLAPTRMLQGSHVALVEYGVTQDLTVVGYLPFQMNQLHSLTPTHSLNQSLTDPGDIRVLALIVVGRGNRSQHHVNLGVSLPVGMLVQATTVGQPFKDLPALPYQIRTSSGTFDMLVGYTYRKQTDNWTWGAQANGVIPTGKNTLGYEVGNQFQATAWLSRRWSERWSTSARLDGHLTGNIRGADPRLDPALSPANQPGTQGYHNLSGLLGANYLLTRPGHRIEEQRLFIEAGVPLYQWVDGPQLGLAWILNAGWGMAF